MRTRLIKTLSLVAFFIIGSFIQLKAQTTDHLKYTILFDVSKSTSYADHNQNLYTLLNELLSFEKNKLNAQISFQIIPFGNGVHESDIINFNLNHSDDDRKKVIQKLRSYNQNRLTKNQMYTDLLKALEYVKNGSGGHLCSTVIIMTDGLMSKNDIPLIYYNKTRSDDESIKKYKEDINSALDTFELKKVSYFFIQSSPKARNFIKDFSLLKNKDDHNLFSEKIYWIDKDVNLKNNDNKKYLKQFNDFKNQINAQIVDLHALPFRRKETKVEEFFKIAYVLADSNELLPKSSLEIQTVIDNLKSKNKLTHEEISQVLDLISHLPLEDKSLLDNVYHNSEGFANMDQRKNLNEFLEISNQVAINVESIQEKWDEGDLQTNIVLALSEFMVDRAKREALFVFYEQVNTLLNDHPNEAFYRFVHDVLFNNTSTLFENFYLMNEQSSGLDITTVKLALDKDIKDLLKNIASSSYVSASDGATMIYYFVHLFDHLSKSTNLESAFANLVNKDNVTPEHSTLKSNKTYQIITTAFHLIGEMEKNNLSELYKYGKESDAKRKLFSRLLVLKCLPEVTDIENGVNLENIDKKIERFVQEFTKVKNGIIRLDSLKKSMKSGPFEEINKNKREFRKEIIRNICQLVDASSVFYSLFSDEKEKQLILSFQKSIQGIELFLNEKYVEGVVLLYPELLKTFKAVAFRTDSEIESNVDSLYAFFKEYKEDSLIDIKLVSKLKGIDYLSDEKLTKAIEAYENNYCEEYKCKKDKNCNKVKCDKGEDCKSCNTDFKKKHRKFNKAVKRIKEILNGTFKKYIDNLEKEKGSESQNENEKQNEKEQHDKKEITKIVKKVRKEEVIDKDSIHVQKITKLVLFSSELAEIKDKDDVKDILVKYTLPVASYRLKRGISGRYTFMVNSYLGVSDNVEQKELALWGPIGMEASYTFSKFITGSLFFPILDVGNTIANNDLENEDIQFSKIVSPGAFFMLGIGKKIPLSVGFGYQSNPNRKLLVIGIDMPLLNLFSGKVGRRNQ